MPTQAPLEAILHHVDGHKVRVDLVEFFKENEDGIDREEQAAILHTLARGEIYRSGGGAAPEWALEPIEGNVRVETMDKDIQDIKRRAGITEQAHGEAPNEYVARDPAASMIWKAVWNAMQDAEEMGGPEGIAYIALMRGIAQEAAKREKTYRETQDQGYHPPIDR